MILSKENNKLWTADVLYLYSSNFATKSGFKCDFKKECLDFSVFTVLYDKASTKFTNSNPTFKIIIKYYILYLLNKIKLKIPISFLTL